MWQESWLRALVGGVPKKNNREAWQKFNAAGLQVRYSAREVPYVCIIYATPNYIYYIVTIMAFGACRRAATRD